VFRDDPATWWPAEVVEYPIPATLGIKQTRAR
jgi:hypothetical protein